MGWISKFLKDSKSIIEYTKISIVAFLYKLNNAER